MLHESWVLICNKKSRVRGEFLQGFIEANVKNYQTVAPSGKGLPANSNTIEKPEREKGEDWPKSMFIYKYAEVKEQTY